MSLRNFIVDLFSFCEKQSLTIKEILNNKQLTKQFTDFSNYGIEQLSRIDILITDLLQHIKSNFKICEYQSKKIPREEKYLYQSNQSEKDSSPNIREKSKTNEKDSEKEKDNETESEFEKIEMESDMVESTSETFTEKENEQQNLMSPKEKINIVFDLDWFLYQLIQLLCSVSWQFCTTTYFLQEVIERSINNNSSLWSSEEITTSIKLCIEARKIFWTSAQSFIEKIKMCLMKEGERKALNSNKNFNDFFGSTIFSIENEIKILKPFIEMN
ncbi:u3 small nucleolar ribonucleoprotein mpp10 [Anaeramoeba ignava]|uniref:U3 small nucleolar ribonucleoprotein mpp10 n=1 Tax=Anaeramoeba ignava TaxID=1746090 RepID=A0A9Q0LKJ5_ANAIG|nr:u3 small nucleolar ribonucleoprotein mpp10 [Anaeramoeba ignava]